MRDKMSKLIIASRVKRMWKLRDDNMTRALIRAYLGDRRNKSGGISQMADSVAKYYTAGLDDYVIYPVILMYLKLMVLDLDFNNVYGNHIA